MVPSTPSSTEPLAPFVPDEAAVSLAIRKLRERSALPDILRALKQHFGYEDPQGCIVVREATLAIQRVMDDEGVIEATVADTLGKLLKVQEDLYDHAVAPLPTRVLDVLGNDPDDPMANAIYREPTPTEKAQAVQTKIAAAKGMAQVTQQVIQIVSKRSKRWADKPAAIIVGDVGSMTEEDKDFLKRLGLME